MALIDHFGKNHTEDTVSVSVHGFVGGIILLIDGDITRPQLVSFFELDDTVGNDKDQLDQLIANYQAKPTAVEKLAYVYKIEMVLINHEAGYGTDAQIRSFLGLT